MFSTVSMYDISITQAMLCPYCPDARIRTTMIAFRILDDGKACTPKSAVTRIRRLYLRFQDNAVETLTLRHIMNNL